MNINNQSEKIATAIKMNIYNLVDTLKATHNTNMQLVWDNSDANPQDILNCFGEDAAKIFELSSALTNFIQYVDPQFIPKEPTKEYTINEDGTVEIVEN